MRLDIYRHDEEPEIEDTTPRPEHVILGHVRGLLGTGAVWGRVH